MMVTVRKLYHIELDEREAKDVAVALRERGSQLRSGASITLSNGHAIASRSDARLADMLTGVADAIEDAED